MKLLGIDYGRKRIGLATCGLLKIAHPLTILQRTTLEKDLEQIAHYIEEHEISQIILGLPKNMDNSHGEMAQEAEKFAQDLQNHQPEIPITLWDERLSSWQAKEMLKERATKKKQRQQKIDHAAAALILQSYVDSQ